MKTKVKVQAKNTTYNRYLWILGSNILWIALLTVFQQFPDAVENYYSRAFYPWFAYLPKGIFGWIPFSSGDVLYLTVFCYLLYLFSMLLIALFKRGYQIALRQMLSLLCILSSLYIFFYLSWGMNYYRFPLHEQIGLRMLDNIQQDDYLAIVDKYIQQANSLRERLVVESLSKDQAKEDLALYMQSDTLFDAICSKTQIKAKSPVSSELISHFTVAGYFNPFTHEVQVNEKIYIASYPFTVVHELSHQMGIGFEDECNFIAFLKLKDHPNPWYAYSAAYETLKYLLRGSYFQDKEQFQQYYRKLSDQVKADYDAERKLWQSYAGWVNEVSDFFYSGYLKHNNQPEGMARYSLMSRLVLAWEMR